MSPCMVFRVIKNSDLFLQQTAYSGSCWGVSVFCSMLSEDGSFGLTTSFGEKESLLKQSYRAANNINVIVVRLQLFCFYFMYFVQADMFSLLPLKPLVEHVCLVMPLAES